MRVYAVAVSAAFMSRARASASPISGSSSAMSGPWSVPVSRAGSKLIALAGVPFGTPGSTNLLHVVTLAGDELEKHGG